MTRYRVRVELIEVVEEDHGFFGTTADENIMDAVEVTCASKADAERVFAAAGGCK